MLKPQKFGEWEPLGASVERGHDACSPQKWPFKLGLSSKTFSDLVMAAIVGVHGIAQETSSAVALEAEWLPALKDSMSRSVRLENHRHPNKDWNSNDADLQMAFYGDIFLRPGQQGFEDQLFSDSQRDLADQLAMAWLERAARRATEPDQKLIAIRELMTLSGNGEQSQGLGRTAGLAIRSLAKLRWCAPLGMQIAETFIRRSLAQVTLYLTDESIRFRAQDRVRALVRTETQVVIGHSLGSIVAYEALQQVRLKLLVTIGSPLGLDTIIYPKLVPQPPYFPRKLQRWVNVADPDDFIAAENNLAGLFKTQSTSNAVLEDRSISGNPSDPHRADFYLRSLEVGRPIVETLATRS